MKGQPLAGVVLAAASIAARPLAGPGGSPRGNVSDASQHRFAGARSEHPVPALQSKASLDKSRQQSIGMHDGPHVDSSCVAFPELTIFANSACPCVSDQNRQTLNNKGSSPPAAKGAAAGTVAGIAGTLTNLAQQPLEQVNLQVVKGIADQMKSGLPNAREFVNKILQYLNVDLAEFADAYSKVEKMGLHIDNNLQSLQQKLQRVKERVSKVSDKTTTVELYALLILMGIQFAVPICMAATLYSDARRASSTLTRRSRSNLNGKSCS